MLITAGTVVMQGIRAMRVSLPGRTALPEESVLSAEVQLALAEHDGQLLPCPRIEGFEDRLIRFDVDENISPPEGLHKTTILSSSEGLVGKSIAERYDVIEEVGRGSGSGRGE